MAAPTSIIQLKDIKLSPLNDLFILFDLFVVKAAVSCLRFARRALLLAKIQVS